MSQIMAVAQQGESILGIRASEIQTHELNSPWLQHLTASMQATMLERNGVGIAAPQVYVSKRVIIVASRSNVRYPDAPEMQPIIMLNPVITQRSEQTILGEEGCLSVPDTRGQVARAEKITVQYLDLQGQPVEIRLESFPARIVQHEVDHLDGILFTERL